MFLQLIKLHGRRFVTVYRSPFFGDLRRLVVSGRSAQSE